MNPAAPHENFTETRRPYVRWTFYLLCVCLALLVGIAAGLVYFAARGDSHPMAVNETGLSGELRRDLAGMMLSAGLTDKAVEQYTLYLSESDVPPGRRAKIAYTIGKLCMDNGRYEDALSWLYQVEMLDPKTKLAPEVGSKIVACLESLGRFSQAQYSLDARSSLDRETGDEFKGGEVVARIGKDVITLKELDTAMDALPEWMRRSLDDPAQKEAFLQQYVAEELLFRKAKKLEMDKDPLVRKQAERALRQLLVQRVLESEIQDKVKITPDDVALYYKANREQYQEKEAFRIRMIRVNPDRLDPVQEALKEGKNFSDLVSSYSSDNATREKGGLLEAWIEEGMDPTGMGDPGKLWVTLSGKKEGDLCGPVMTDEAGYLFRIEARRAPRSPSLEEVQSRVQQDLNRERVEKTYQELIQQALQGSDVKLFLEVVHKHIGKDTGRGNAETGNQDRQD